MVKFVLGALVGAVGYKLWVDEKEHRDSIQKLKEINLPQRRKKTK